MTRQEIEALAVLRIGGSFADAAEASGLSVEAVMALWERAGS